MSAPGPATVERLGRGRDLFNRRLFFEAHEVWEEAWLSEEGPMRALLQGLIQVAAGFHKGITQGKAEGCVRLLAAGVSKLPADGSSALGAPLAEFRVGLQRALAEARRWQRGEAAGLDPSVVPPLTLETSVKS